MLQTKEIKLRLSPEDHEQLTQAAKSLGMPLAVYIKAAALEKMHKQQPSITHTRPQAIATEPPAKLDNPKVGYYTKTSNATPAQIASSLITITRTDLEDRLKNNLPPTKAHTIPAQLKRLPLASLTKYTQDRDPEGKSWQPTNEQRSLWAVSP